MKYAASLSVIALLLTGCISMNKPILSDTTLGHQSALFETYDIGNQS